MPRKDKKVSVFRTTDCDNFKIWWISDWYVYRKIRQKAVARADLQAKVVRELDMKVVSTNLPRSRRHADIKGWPDDDQKALQFSLELAHKSRLVIRG